MKEQVRVAVTAPSEVAPVAGFTRVLLVDELWPTPLSLRRSAPRISPQQYVLHLSERCGCPLYSLRGRMRALDADCSMMCVVHPVIRLITKIGVKLGMSNPIR